MKKDVYEKIKEYEKIIIHRHVRPDPDAFGSQAGLKEIIQQRFPEKKVLLAGQQELSLSFLASMDEISDEDFQNALVIVCDTANRERIDDGRFNDGDYLIKIDHHPDVDVYGDISWVDTEASSTSEMICSLFEEFKKDGGSMPDEGARLLYAGIVGDTGRFRFSNTTEKTFYYAGELIKHKFSRTALYDEMYETSLPLLRLEGYVLSNLELRPSGAGVVTLTMDKLEEYGVTSKEAAAIVNAFSTLRGLKAWVFFVEESPELIRIRLRSKGPEIHKLAEKYNGGGHPMASGASASNWEETEEFTADLDKICSEFPG